MLLELSATTNFNPNNQNKHLEHKKQKIQSLILNVKSEINKINKGTIY